MGKMSIPKEQMLKFLLISIVGLGAFLLPIYVDGEYNTIIGILTGWVEGLLSGIMDAIIFVLITVSTIGSLLDYIFTKTGRSVNVVFHKFFGTSIVYLITKLLALVITVMFYCGVGPEFIIGADVSGSMVGLAKTLIALALSFSFLLPFLTEGGLMEFFGEITRPFVRPMFKVPSDASLDLIASWLGAANAAVLLSAEKYYKGYYSKREAAIVMCNFSLVSVPFCMVIAETTGISQYFPVMYALLCVLGVILAVILPRIYPLSKLTDEFAVELHENIDVRNERNMLKRALIRGCAVADDFDAKKVFGSGWGVLSSVCINLLPTVIAWGVLGLIVVQYTPILEWISLPMGWLLNVMGVEEAFKVAPATLAGFVDMFIPALLITSVESAQTRFIIATLSLIQIIYITEVGAIIIQTDLGVDLKRLFIIFLERTLISLPLIVLASMLIF